ncbi:hypothetical protein Dsin_016980 [Dipteronia sinensis]|uniref:DDE Tnp4 domain-containing protein n=1 Tax=Dipteronia sinensis TaxID=43782 RepID=A0AAE0AE87_9ROSI|nr:hypothetical protein Dsin_016980 [Dipteronia sinensis]
MAPYRQVSYWLGDFRNGDRANGKEEIFNHSHSKLRNVIERAFGVLKARFPILKRMSLYSLYTQKYIVIACITLHNFLRQISIDDELFSQYDDEELIMENDNANHQLPSTNNSSGTSNAVFMQRFRDHATEQL